MSSSLRTTFFLQLEPIWQRGYSDPKPTGFRVSSITKSRPNKPRGGTVTVKLTLAVPPAAFLPLRPEAEVVIPVDLIETNYPVTVEATTPEEGK